MEKLQAALESARQKRAGQQGQDASGRAAVIPARKQKDAAPDPWDALKRCETSDAILKSHRVVSRQAGARSTPFDILRTKILLQMRQYNWTRLAITSPMPKSGKTTMACNLAMGFGRQRDLRTLLFDLDLRDPAVGEFLGITPETSFADVLADRVDFADHALRIGDNVAVSLSNSQEKDPVQLLLAEETAERLEDIQSVYAPDLMIFDLPSMLSGDESRAFLKNVDCALIVVRANETRYGHFDQCEKEVAQHTNVVGVVLNACNHHGSSDES